MSNTQKRIISSVVLIALLILAINLGIYTCLLFVLLIGVMTIDEIMCNFLKKKRLSLHYLQSEFSFVVPFIIINLFFIHLKFQDIFTYAALILNISLIYYLFFTKLESTFVVDLGRRFPVLWGSFILLPILTLSSLLHYEQWQILLGTLLIVTYGMDTGAWFFGRTFGKNKLWPDISPKKTIEGLLGGMIVSGFGGTCFWHFTKGLYTVKIFFLFVFLGLISQIGDLIQSKIKRQFQLKDSSSLIPGHGGVYDRIDSLIFVAPFYLTALKYFQF